MISQNVISASNIDNIVCGLTNFMDDLIAVEAFVIGFTVVDHFSNTLKARLCDTSAIVKIS